MNYNIPLPYIKKDNIYIIPVLPERLSGALMVRKAVQELQLGRGDLVAIARPKSVKEIFLQAVGELPKSRLIYIKDPNSPNDNNLINKELVTITPCDGLTEACRSAVESNIELRFIDLDVSPLLQAQRPPCRQESLGFDDWLCLTLGAEMFVDLFHDHPMLQHRRIQPVDDWREKHMAGQLQRFHTRYKRIIFTCYVENVPGVVDALGQPPTILDAPEFKGEILNPTRLEASLLLQFLDDYPKVVERYWNSRTSPEAIRKFDKMSVVLEEIIDCAASQPTAGWSMRHHKSFKHMLCGIMKETGRTSIPLNECLAVINACYDRNFENVVRTQLLTFTAGNVPKEIAQHTYQRTQEENKDITNGLPKNTNNYDAMEVGMKGGHSTSINSSFDRDSHNHTKSGQQVFVRSCNNSRHFESFVEDNSWFDPRLMWPAWVMHHNEMRKRILRVATNMTLAVSSEKYRGSLERGLDLRRIMRASYKGDPLLYVRRRRQSSSLNETPHGVIPILWFFNSTDDSWIKKQGARIWNAEEEGATARTMEYLLGKDWGNEKIFVSPNWYFDKRRLVVNESEFMVSFSDFELTPLEIKDRFGDAATQPPTQDINKGYLNVLHKIVDSATSHIFCIVPPNNKVPNVLNKYVQQSRKQIIVLTHSDVGTLDIKKLSHCVTVDIGQKPKTKENIRMAVQQYKDMVDLFWY